MTDIDEERFREQVADHYRGVFGDEAVEESSYLHDTGRIVDIRVNSPVGTFMVEVENDWESALEGIGQSIMYAAHLRSGIPVVAVPEGHVDYPEVDYLRESVQIVEFEYEEGGDDNDGN